MDATVANVTADHPLQKVSLQLRAEIVRAQHDSIEIEYADAYQLCARALSDLKIAVLPPDSTKELSAAAMGDRSTADLVEFFSVILRDNSIPEQSVALLAAGLAHRTQLIRAFRSPEAVIDQTCEKVSEVVGSFPRTAEQIRVGKNPGDVLDPYILSAAQVLVFGNDFEQTVSAAISHKVFMIIEGLLGHLHEDVIGAMRGNMRAPEPRGRDQETFDLNVNPFPGADVVQPPLANGRSLRFHQIKSKTGSAKGGDAKRLGMQLKHLTDTYGGQAFYVALIGHTLRGHRSMTGVLKAAPDVVVVVGEAAFRELTGSDAGPQLLLRLYQSAFEVAAKRSGFSLPEVISAIYIAFQERANELGADFLEAVLHDAIAGQPDQQDSRIYSRPPGRGKSKKQ